MILAVFKDIRGPSSGIILQVSLIAFLSTMKGRDTIFGRQSRLCGHKSRYRKPDGYFPGPSRPRKARPITRRAFVDFDRGVLCDTCNGSVDRIEKAAATGPAPLTLLPYLQQVQVPRWSLLGSLRHHGSGFGVPGFVGHLCSDLPTV